MYIYKSVYSIFQAYLKIFSSSFTFVFNPPHMKDNRAPSSGAEYHHILSESHRCCALSCFR